LREDAKVTHAATSSISSRPFAVAALALAASLAFAGAAAAQKAPGPEQQEVLIKSSLMTFNDANVTGNYTVLHAKLSQPFRDQFTPDKLKQSFKAFADAHIDFDLIVAKPPVLTEPAKVDDEGRLLLRGYFDTRPSRVNYDLAFIRSEGEWKLIRLNVDVKKPEQ
jgi:opacity protein-like surface antigen